MQVRPNTSCGPAGLQQGDLIVRGRQLASHLTGRSAESGRSREYSRRILLQIRRNNASIFVLIQGE